MLPFLAQVAPPFMRQSFSRPRVSLTKFGFGHLVRGWTILPTSPLGYTSRVSTLEGLKVPRARAHSTLPSLPTVRYGEVCISRLPAALAHLGQGAGVGRDWLGDGLMRLG